MDLTHRRMFEQFAAMARDEPPEVAQATAIAALNSGLLIGVLISYAAGRELGIALALAPERDAGPLVEAGFETEVRHARAIVDRVAEVAGFPEPSDEEAAAMARVRESQPRRH